MRVRQCYLVVTTLHIVAYFMHYTTTPSRRVAEVGECGISPRDFPIEKRLRNPSFFVTFKTTLPEVPARSRYVTKPRFCGFRHCEIKLFSILHSQKVPMLLLSTELLFIIIRTQSTHVGRHAIRCKLQNNSEKKPRNKTRKNYYCTSLVLYDNMLAM